MFHRGSRGSRRRSGMRPIVHTFKKILTESQAGFSAGTNTETLIAGVDSIALGQTTQTDANVPTGSIIKYIECQFSCNNSTANQCYVTCTLQYTLSDQAVVSPILAGGNSQRNQIMHMDLFSVGQDQNSTHKFKFKIPPKFQRIREGMQWLLVWQNSATVNRQLLTIYKVQV